MSARLLALALAVSLGATGCDVDFEPIAPSDLYFSVSGYLDATPDTQWVRVEPLAPTTEPDPDPLDVVVTLEDTRTGIATPMEQVVRTFRTGPAHLFWTTADVEPGVTYRLAVRRPDGAETRVTVVVPPEEDVDIEISDGPFECPTRVYVRGADRLADVQSRYTLGFQGGREFRFSKLESIVEEPGGALSFTIYYGEDAERMGITGFPLPPEQVRTEVTVALGTEDWPDAIGLDLETALVLAPSARIENGVGFVGGTVSTTQEFVPGVLTFGFGGSRPCVRP